MNLASFSFEPQNLDLFLTLLKAHLDIQNEIVLEGYDISAKDTIDLEKTYSYKAKRLASSLILKFVKLSRKNRSLSIISNYSEGFLRSFLIMIQKKII